MARTIRIVLCLAAIPLLGTAPQHKPAPHDRWLEGVASGKTQVVDMTYAINGKMPAWPGDSHTPALALPSQCAITRRCLAGCVAISEHDHVAHFGRQIEAAQSRC